MFGAIIDNIGKAVDAVGKQFHYPRTKLRELSRYFNHIHKWQSDDKNNIYHFLAGDKNKSTYGLLNHLISLPIKVVFALLISGQAHLLKSHFYFLYYTQLGICAIGNTIIFSKINLLNPFMLASLAILAIAFALGVVTGGVVMLTLGIMLLVNKAVCMALDRVIVPVIAAGITLLAFPAKIIKYFENRNGETKAQRDQLAVISSNGILNAAFTSNNHGPIDQKSEIDFETEFNFSLKRSASVDAGLSLFQQKNVIVEDKDFNNRLRYKSF